MGAKLTAVVLGNSRSAAARSHLGRMLDRQLGAYSLDEKLGFFLDTQISQLLILGRNRVDER
ncbi:MULTISPECIES: hypothetical protein [unclassified Microcoleus]|uniref:hypothetical protein n=1 Tax=unclassified Microcoleus TaxID=2642155 RepID=UPI0025F9EED8|nr:MULTISPECIES: hypothetical protein [unclassified Microcoleus]